MSETRKYRGRTDGCIYTVHLTGEDRLDFGYHTWSRVVLPEGERVPCGGNIDGVKPDDCQVWAHTGWFHLCNSCTDEAISNGGAFLCSTCGKRIGLDSPEEYKRRKC